jgi:glycosyltransferase involved in cell wall biosynthesis/radical SAM superfamily enzyme YgiQ (UPF0313 family)/ADP-heptose:LPS heptosyltransferase
MRILIVSLPAGQGADEPIFPLGIGYLNAILKKEHQVKVAHYQKFEHVGSTLPELLGSFNPEVVGFTCTTFNRGNVRNIISIIKKYRPDIKIVVGGVHASFLYEQVLHNYGADVVVIGEGEYTALELCRALKNGTCLDDVHGIAFERAGAVILTPPRPPIENLDELPMPDYDFAEHLMKVSGMGFIITSRGCPVRCTFCSTSSYWGQKVRKNTVTRVVDEMEYLVDRYKVRKIFFHDDTFNLGIERVNQICSEILRRNINIEWAASCRVTPVSQEMVDLMAEAGCRHICWGVETGSETMLKNIEKKITLDQIRNAYEFTKKHSRIMSSGAFAMVGNHGETDQTISETVEFFNSIPLTDCPSTAMLRLLPGTKIYFDGKSRGLVDDSIWLENDDVPGTNEHSDVTLQRWAQMVSSSGNMLSFDKQKHFWNNILFGNVPKLQAPQFFIDQRQSVCDVSCDSKNTKQKNLDVSASELDNIIPPEIKDDEFYSIILKLAREENVKTVLEIGSSAGEGSTDAFVSGLRENKNKPTLFCLEVSKPRFSKLQKRYESDSCVKCYYASSIPTNKFLSKDEVVQFYNSTRTTLANYPIDRVLGWLRQDIDYVESSDAPNNGIQMVKTDNGIINFDMVLIDGSAFTGGAELDEVYGAKIILLDDINDIKNYNNYKRLSGDANYTMVTENWKLRNGYAVFKRNDPAVPIHFFTIVLNGEPFIRYHAEVFNQLLFKWHWHIIEGVADLKHDTAWALQTGGRISSELHRNGRSNDGTTEYLDELVRQYPENITVYRKDPGVFWDGKLEMVNAPLAAIKQECLLWQVDADELWTSEQIKTVRDMFMAEPDRTAAYYLDHFFVGEKLITTTIDTYGNNTGYEWLRTWRFKPGCRWAAHEPPRLCMPADNGNWTDIAAIKPFKHSQTCEKGLVFQHYAYATEKQLGFKEIYYGYKNAIAQWQRLQQQRVFPVFLRNYFAWVTDAAQVNTVESQNVTPIAIRESDTRWRFGSPHLPSKPSRIACQDVKRILWSRTDSIGDAILASSTLPYLRKGFPAAKITVLCQKHIAELFEHCPFIDSVITIPTEHKWESAAQHADVLQAIKKLQPDLLINSVYSEHVLSDPPGLEFIPRRFAYRNTSTAAYTDIIATPDGIRSDLSRHSDMLKGLGLGEHTLQPALWTSDADERWADEFFKANGLRKEKTIALFAGARDKIKTYSGYGKAISRICKSRGFNLLALGSSGDIPLNQQNLNDAGVPSLNLSGKLSLRQSVAIIRRCGFAIGTDTSLAHIACAVATPNVVLMGGGHFGRFHPYSSLTSVVVLPLACFGCEWQCRHSKPHCIQSVAEESIAEAVVQMLDKPSDKPRIFLQQTTNCGVAFDSTAVTQFAAVHPVEIVKLATASSSSAQVAVGAKNFPKITIVTPSFNQAKYLEHCIRSVLEQEYPNLEYIVIDGGSTDGSVDIIKKYSSRIHWWVSEPDQGQYHAIMKGVARSGGTIMGWLNSDDTLHPGSLGILADVLGNNENVEWLTGQPNIKDAAGRTVIINEPSQWSRARYLSGDFKWIQQESTYWKRSLWDRAGARLNTDYSLAADMELWARFFRHAQLYSINSLIGSFRYHGDQKSQLVMDKYLLQADKIVANEIRSFLLDEKLKFNPSAPPVIRYDWALREFAVGVAEPVSVEALTAAGQEAFKAGRVLPAAQAFLQIVPLRPQNANICTILGSLYKALGLPSAAAIAYSKALALDPADKTAKKNLDELGQINTAAVKALSSGNTAMATKAVAAENFDCFTFSKKSHIAAFRCNENIRPDSDLKAYQDLLVLNFILDNVPSGSRLLEIGGGESRIIDALQHKYECWNIDKLEGLGSGPLTVQPRGNKLVRDYMGNFNRELPDDYFDLVFSISALEHVPEDESTFKNICLDIDRVLKSGGYSLHCFDVVLKKEYAWTNQFVPFIFSFCSPSHKFVPLQNLYDDPDLWSMSEAAYNRCWAPITKRPYSEHGKPVSYNVLWQKQPIATDPLRKVNRPQVDLKAGEKNQKGEVLVSAIVSTYKSQRYLAECLEDLERQSIADKLEIIVVDSGSPENEAQIVLDFQKRYSNIKYIRTPQRESVYQAWNRGIKEATGRYITNANTDDRHYEQALEKMAQTLDNNPDKPGVYARFVGVKENDGVRAYCYDSPSLPFSFDSLLSYMFTIGPQPMWRRSMHEKCGYFDEGFVSGGDEEFWFRIAQHGDLLFIDEVLGEFLENPDSVSHESDRGVACFESTFIRNCYREARWRGITIGKEGLTNSSHSFVKECSAARLVRRNFLGKFDLPYAADVVATKEIGSRDAIPQLSVIVYGDNDINDIRATISGLSSCQNAPMEVILISRHSPAAIEPDLKCLTCDVMVVQLAEDMGMAFARNAAYQYARAEILAFIDAAFVPEADWAANTIAAFGTETTMAIRGRIVAAPGMTVPAVFDLGNDLQPCALETLQSCAIRRTVFEMIGGFNALAFAHHGLEASFKIFQHLDDITAVFYRPDVRVRACRQELCRDVDETVGKEAIQTLRGRFPAFKIYYTAIRSLHPSSGDHSDIDFYAAFNASLILKNAAPHAAIRLAERAVKLEPLVVKACFVLGTLYAKGDKWPQSISLLERVLTLSRGDLAIFREDKSKEGRESWMTTSACYVNAAALLAQSFFKLKQMGKAKTIYMHLLGCEELFLSPEQRQSFSGLVGRLQNIPPEPVEDGLADVPREAIERSLTTPEKKCTAPETSHVQHHDDRPLVSAIVSTYNSEKFLRGCLEDLERQTIADKIEIIIVNSGSKQNEETIVKEFQTRYKNIVYIKTEQREGIYSAWNRAIKVARGRFVTNANTDDRHRADAMEIMAKELMADPAVGLVYADQITTDTANATFESHNRSSELKWDEYSYDRLKLGCCVGSQPMWRAAVHGEVGYFDESLTCAGDWDFWLRIADKHKLKHLPHFLGLYYNNEEGIEHSRKIHSLYERYVVGKRYGTPYIAIIPYVEGPDYPLVSVIMPAYNAQQYIAEAIESVLIQSYRNFELVIVDDGSTDRTKEIVTGFKDEKIRYFYKENGGASSARNLGIKESNGWYLVMLDADDMMTPEYILSHIQHFQNHQNADLVYCDHRIIDVDDKPVRELRQFEYEDRRYLIRDMFRCGYPVIQPRGCIKKSVFEKIDCYDESLVVGEDYDLMRRFVLHNCKAVRLPKVLYLRRLQPESLSQANTQAKATSHFIAVRRWVETFCGEELFPEVDWSKITSDRRSTYLQMLIGATYRTIGKNYAHSQVEINAAMAFDLACTALKESLRNDPANDQARRLLDQCEEEKRQLAVTETADASAMN